jgi:hypothetical protein
MLGSQVQRGFDDIAGSGRTMTLRAQGQCRSSTSRAQERHMLREDDVVVSSRMA